MPMPEFGFGDVAMGLDESATQDFVPSFTPTPAVAAPVGPGFDANAMLTGAEKAAGVTRMGPPSGGGGGFGDFANIAKQALPWLQLGTTGLGAISGIQAAGAAGRQAQTAERAGKVQAESARQAQATAQPAAAFGQQQLQQASAGQIPGPIQAQIDEWVQAAKQQAQQYAARSGEGDSTMLTTWLSWIDKQGQAMKAQALEQEQKMGLAGIQTAEEGLGGAARAAAGAGATATGEVNALDSLIASANAQLSKLSAGAA